MRFRPGKKLKAAAAAWARGGDAHDQAREDLRAFGAVEADLDLVAPLDPDVGENGAFELWPENWAAWQAFCAVQTQWAHGMSGLTALDYQRVKAGLELAGVEITRELFDKLRLIEGGVLETLGKEAKKKPAR